MKKGDFDQVLLVEGNDDLHVIAALCECFNVKESFGIKDCNGIDNILAGLHVRLKGSGEIKTLGVVIDADSQAVGRWLSVREILQKTGRYDYVPDDCPPDGLVINPRVDGDMRFGLWIMPDNRTDGMLEDFVTFLIPKGDRLLPIADKVLKEIEMTQLNAYSVAHHEKARIHTWLAWQESPGTPMGQAITKKYLETDSAICHNFVDWLNRLYNSKL